MLAPSGRLMGDLTTMRLADDRFQLGGSGYLQTWHMRWFAEHLAQNGVEIRNVTDYYGGLALIGPSSRELMTRLAGTEVRSRLAVHGGCHPWTSPLRRRSSHGSR